MVNLSLRKKRTILVGLLCLVLAPVMAVPVSQDTIKSSLSDSNFNDVFYIGDHYSISSYFEQSKQNYELDSISLILDIIDSDFLLPETKNIEEARYSEFRKKNAKIEARYAEQNYNFKSTLFNNTSSGSGSGLWILLEPLKDNIHIKENMLEILDSIKNIQGLLTANTEITYENSQQEVNNVINEHIIKQDKRNEEHLLENKETTISKKIEENHISPLKIFLKKLEDVLIYMLIGAFFIAIIWIFIKWKGTFRNKKKKIRKHRRQGGHSKIIDYKHNRIKAKKHNNNESKKTTPINTYKKSKKKIRKRRIKGSSKIIDYKHDRIKAKKHNNNESKKTTPINTYKKSKKKIRKRRIKGSSKIIDYKHNRIKAKKRNKNQSKKHHRLKRSEDLLNIKVDKL